MDDINIPEMFKMKHTLSKIQLLESVRNEIKRSALSIYTISAGVSNEVVKVEEIDRIIDKWIRRCET